VTLGELLQAVACTRVSLATFTTSGEALLAAETPALGVTLPLTLSPSPLYERLRESLGIFSTEDVYAEQTLAGLEPFFTARQTHSLLVLPLVIGTDLIGLLFIQTVEVHRFTPDEIELALTIANQAAVAMQNARLFAETERLVAETRQNSAELSFLFEMGVEMTQVLDQRRLVEACFQNCLRLCIRTLPPWFCWEKISTWHSYRSGCSVGPLDIQRTGSS
jgi:GAF domain-containing protein